MENIKDYCPSHDDDICNKFKVEFEQKRIKCYPERAEILKDYLQFKCKEMKSDRMKGINATTNITRSAAIYPEHYLLPEHVRPEFYEVWLWVKEEPIIEGNVTIDIIVKGYISYFAINYS